MLLKWGWAFEMDGKAGGGMCELNILGVQHKAFVGAAVKIIAYDRGVQTLGMGAVDAQLMCPACLGKQIQHGSNPTLLVCALHDDLEMADGRLSMCGINHLAWTVHDVVSEGQVDVTFGTGYVSLHDGFVAFLHFMVGKLCLQCLLCLLVLCEDENT